MQTLVIVEHDNHTVNPATKHVLSAARQWAGEVTLLIIGYQCQSVVDEAAILGGVKTVLVADHQDFAHQMPENVAPLVVHIGAAFEAILTTASTYGKNVLPRVAALFDMGQVSDVIEIIDAKTVKHPIYAGNAIETVRILDEKTILTIRATAFEAITETQPPCIIEKIDQTYPLKGATFIDCQHNQSSRPELTQAKVIVSGGRGLQNKENFKLIEALADTLGAAVGASRAAVDAGFVPNDYQVGQTGKVVAPLLYVAVGISGAIQHLAGMKDAKVIVAVNKDADAPMVQLATYALVGDLFEIVPQLITLLKGLQR